MKESSESHHVDNLSTSEAADDSQHDADADASNHNNNDTTATALEDLKQVWLVQQKEIAAAVITLEDDDDDDENIMPMPRLFSDNVSSDDPSPLLFRCLDLNDADLAGTRLVGGTDISFPTTDDDDDAPAVAVYTVLRVADHAVVYCAHRYFTLQVPYVPSFLAFREIEPLVELIEEQRQQSPHLTPDVILVDGNGIWHERSAGLASALGVRLDLPTIGVGKTLYNAGGWHRGLLEPGLVTHVLRQAVRQLIPDDESQQRQLQPQQQQHQQAAADHDHGEVRRFPDGLFIAWMRQAIDANMAQSYLDDNVASSSSAVPPSAAPAPPPDEMALTKGELVRHLSSATRGALRGVAFRLVGRHDDDDDHHPRRPQQQCAVVLGHGGRNNTNGSTSQPDTATGGCCHKPVFVSIGHKVSLRHAVALVCHLSSVRVPEPIRQADLRGRALMRNQKKKNEKKNRPSQKGGQRMMATSGSNQT
jgi:deoxyinosine 3'endonuclease (endonuclease V)